MKRSKAREFLTMVACQAAVWICFALVVSVGETAISHYLDSSQEPQPVEIRPLQLGETVTEDVQPDYAPMVFREICFERGTQIRVWAQTPESGAWLVARIRGETRRFAQWEITWRRQSDMYWIDEEVWMPAGCVQFTVVDTGAMACGGCTCGMPSFAYTLYVGPL